MQNDLTFITNEQGRNLKDRFAVLIKDTRFFDVLVGYFYTSGFYAVYPTLEKTEKIRILIGISTNRQTYDLIQKIQSYKEIGEQFGEAVKEEMELSENNFKVEEGVQKFLEWLKNGKLENPKPNDACFNNVHNYLIGSVKSAAEETISYLKSRRRLTHVPPRWPPAGRPS